MSLTLKPHSGRDGSVNPVGPPFRTNDRICIPVSKALRSRGRMQPCWLEARWRLHPWQSTESKGNLVVLPPVGSRDYRLIPCAPRSAVAPSRLDSRIDPDSKGPEVGWKAAEGSIRVVQQPPVPGSPRVLR